MICVLHEVYKIVEKELSVQEYIPFGVFHRLHHEQVVLGEEEKRGRFAASGLKTVDRSHVIAGLKRLEQLLFRKELFSDIPKDLRSVLLEFNFDAMIEVQVLVFILIRIWHIKTCRASTNFLAIRPELLKLMRIFVFIVLADLLNQRLHMLRIIINLLSDPFE